MSTRSKTDFDSWMEIAFMAVSRCASARNDAAEFPIYTILLNSNADPGLQVQSQMKQETLKRARSQKDNQGNQHAGGSVIGGQGPGTGGRGVQVNLLSRFTVNGEQ